MNLRFLEAFVWIARLGSFSAAATKLHATQAGISDRIRTLETELAVRLFERGGRRAALTAAGQQLLPHAERMLELAQRMRAEFAAGGAQQGTVALGVIESVAHTWLSQLLRLVHDEFPAVTIELRSDATPRLAEDLRRGQLDLAVLADGVTDAAIDNEMLATWPMAWVAHPDIQANGADGGGDDAFEALLASQPVMSFARDTPAYRDVQRALQGYPAFRLNAFSSIAAIVSVLRSGLGIAALPEAVVAPLLRRGQLARIEAGPALEDLRLWLATPRAVRSPLADRVAALAMRAARESPAPVGSAPRTPASG